MINLSKENRERCSRDLHSLSKRDLEEEEEKRPVVSDKKKKFCGGLSETRA
jgi:hypothetical protein